MDWDRTRDAFSPAPHPPRRREGSLLGLWTIFYDNFVIELETFGSAMVHSRGFQNVKRVKKGGESKKVLYSTSIPGCPPGTGCLIFQSAEILLFLSLRFWSDWLSGSFGNG